MGKTETIREGDCIRFEFDGILGEMPSFVAWPNEEPLRISRIQPTPCELTHESGRVRVSVRGPLDGIVSGSFCVLDDDGLVCKKPVLFDGPVKAEVSGPKGQRARFTILGKLVPKDEI